VRRALYPAQTLNSTLVQTPTRRAAWVARALPQ
jgi:hypothetical protein